MRQNKYGQIVTALYTFEMIWQALFTLVLPIGIGFGVGWVLTHRFSLPDWIFVPLLLLGTLLGLYSMVSFILTVSRQTEALEAQEKQKQIEKKGSDKDER